MAWVRRNGSLVYVERGFLWYVGVGTVVMIVLSASCSMCVGAMSRDKAAAALKKIDDSEKRGEQDQPAPVPESQRPLKIGKLYSIESKTIGFPTKEASREFYKSIRIGDRQGAAADAFEAGAEVIVDRKVRVLEQDIWGEKALIRVRDGSKLWVERSALFGDGE